MHGLDLGLPTHKSQIYSLTFMWILINWNEGYPKGCCLYVGYVLLAGLPCLVSVGEEAPSFAET